MRRRACYVGWFCLALGACSSSSTNPAATCDVGELKQCSCPNGGTGTRQCESGTFGACQCGDAGVGGSVGSGGTASGGGGTAGAGAASSGGAGGGAEPPSCKGLAPCAGGHSCCESPELPAGTFQRDGKPGANFAATVSPFRLDAFEVTVGRFRNFVTAVTKSNWAPAVGSGQHQPQPLAGELGWQPALDGDLWPSVSEWTANVTKCPASGGGTSTWSSSVGKNDQLPMNCVSFPQAYAFCIWDGGYLPTEAELSYAWVGPGTTPRKFPWGSAAVDAEHATFGIDPKLAPPPVGTGSKGANPLGHHDLFGSMFEFTLDHFDQTASYPKSPCTDCVKLSADPTAARSIRGGGWVNLATDISSGSRLSAFWGGHNTGFRCARPADK